MNSEQWTIYERWIMKGEQCTIKWVMNKELWIMNDLQWIKNNAQWTINNGWWTIHNEQ